MMTGTSGRSARMFGSMSSPLIPGMLMSDKISNQRRFRADPPRAAVPRCGGSEFHQKASRCAARAELLAKQGFHIGSSSTTSM